MSFDGTKLHRWIFPPKPWRGKEEWYGRSLLQPIIVYLVIYGTLLLTLGLWPAMVWAVGWLGYNAGVYGWYRQGLKDGSDMAIQLVHESMEEEYRRIEEQRKTAPTN